MYSRRYRMRTVYTIIYPPVFFFVFFLSSVRTTKYDDRDFCKSNYIINTKIYVTYDKIIDYYHSNESYSFFFSVSKYYLCRYESNFVRKKAKF